MAVVPRKRAGKIVYGVLTSVKGVGKFWELVGPNRREAESVDARRRKEVKAGTFTPQRDLTDAASVKAFALRWLDERRNRSADNDHRLITKHVLSVEWFASMPIGQVRPRHFKKLVGELKRTELSEKSVSIVMGVVSVMFRDATFDEVIPANPYLLPRGMLTRKGKKREPYLVHEAAALMSEPVSERERMWNTLAFYTGGRCGEICGLRWGDWDETPRPLGALVISKQYEGEPLKTDRPRVVPVHPALAARLTEWRKAWSFHFLRRPGPEDFIVPAATATPLTKSAAYHAWIRSCKAAQVGNRSVHSTRHTFLTVARRNGAEEKVIELVTHNAKGTMVDRYTQRDWNDLCRAVSVVSFDVSVDAPFPDASDSRLQSLDSNQSGSAEHRETLETTENNASHASLVLPSDAKSGAPIDARQPGPRGATIIPFPHGANGPPCPSGDLFGSVAKLRAEARR